MPSCSSFCSGRLPHHCHATSATAFCVCVRRDPDLELGPAATVLLATSIDLVLRLNKYKQYPFAMCFLCQRWFPAALRNIADFLHTDAENLDVGFSLQIHAYAWSGRNEMQAIAWLASPPVQNFIVEAIAEMFASSMEVERRHAQAKKWEATRVSHIATASCNLICPRFAKEGACSTSTLSRSADVAES